jgi:hypothetical protein
MIYGTHLSAGHALHYNLILSIHHGLPFLFSPMLFPLSAEHGLMDLSVPVLEL